MCMNATVYLSVTLCGILGGGGEEDGSAGFELVLSSSSLVLASKDGEAELACSCCWA